MRQSTVLLIFGISIFFISWIPVIYPLFNYHTKKKIRFSLLVDNFACGIFLGMGLIHLLSESQNMLSEHFKPLAPIISGMMLIILLIIKNYTQKKSYITSIITLLMLSMHSLFAGIALGVSSWKLSLILFLAIIAHKWAAAFALIITLLKKMPHSKAIMAFTLFSIQTPLGIFIGHILEIHTPIFLESITLALASGTLIYMALQHESYNRTFLYTPYLIIGFSIMGILAFFI